MSLLLQHTLIKSYDQLEPLPHPAELSETFKNTNQYCSPYQIYFLTAVISAKLTATENNML